MRRPRRPDESLREWLLEVDPDLWHVAQEVDFALLKDQLALSPLERVAIFTHVDSGVLYAPRVMMLLVVRPASSS